MTFPTGPAHTIKRKRGRQAPGYGLMVCPWCARQLRMKNFTEWKFHCECGWKNN